MVDQKSETYRPRRAFIEPDVQPAEPALPAESFRGDGRAIPPPLSEEDHPRPLYRDQTRTNGWSSPAPRPVPTPHGDPPTKKASQPITPRPRRTGASDDESTAILPRSRAGQRRTSAGVDAIDDFDENERTR